MTAENNSTISPRIPEKAWIKSSYSGSVEADACVEVAALPQGARAVRDSKLTDSPIFTVGATAWDAFLKGAAS